MSRQVNSGDPSSGFPSKVKFEQDGSIADADLTIIGVVDPSKRIIFNAAAQTTGKTVTIATGANTNNITLTLPATSGTLATSSSVTAPVTEIWLTNQGSDGGFTNNSRKYSTITRNNGGVDLTYTAAAGSITINTAGTYAIYTSDHGSTAGVNFGACYGVVSTDSFNNIDDGFKLTSCAIYLDNYASACGNVAILPQGAVITVQASGTSLNANDNFSAFRVTRIS